MVTGARIGSYLSHPASNAEVLAYRRESDDETMTVVLNLSESPERVPIRSGNVLLSTSDPERADAFRDEVDLSPGEGLLIGHD